MSQLGGGFDASQEGYGNVSQSQYSQSSFQKAQEYLLPVTAAMLSNVEEREMRLFINDRELVFVLFVGKIDSAVATDRKVDYTVMDCSGILQVTKWIDEGKLYQEIPEGSYVMVFGKPSIFNGKPQLTAYKITKCQSYDEVTQHYLSVIYSDLYIKKIGTEAGKVATHNAASNVNTTAKEFPVGNNNSNNENNLADLSQSQRQVLLLIKAREHESDKGVNVNWLSQQLERDAKSDLKYLMDEGHIYDTVTEDWVKTT